MDPQFAEGYFLTPDCTRHGGLESLPLSRTMLQINADIDTCLPTAAEQFSVGHLELLVLLSKAFQS